MQNGTTNQTNGERAPAAEIVHELRLARREARPRTGARPDREPQRHLRAAVSSLNNLIDIVRQVQRERRVSEREVRSVRDTLKTLQTVRL